MRFGRVFIEPEKPAEGEITGGFRRLEEVLGIEFPAGFFYPDLVLLMVNRQLFFDNLPGCLLYTSPSPRD